jgi:hypothetical protein
VPAAGFPQIDANGIKFYHIGSLHQTTMNPHISWFLPRCGFRRIKKWTQKNAAFGR